MKINLAKKTTAYLVAACMAAQPAFAGITDISNVPLGSTTGTTFLPNLLFTLDDSGSMASDYNPDYVNDGNTCMTANGGSTNCQRGDPPFEAGGEHGFNGVGYDPNFNYQPGLSSNGQPVITPPLNTTSLTPNAYLGGSNVNLTTGITDKTFCNTNNVCKRSGADAASGTITPAGTKDPEGNSLAAGQFPYRANVSSGSTINFGLPEMMTTATFTRSGSTVTAATIGQYPAPTVSRPLVPPLTTSDKVYVTTGTSGLDVTCVPVTSVSANGTSFTYTAATSGTIAATNGRYRKCGAGNFARAGSTVTVTAAAGHSLASNDIITTFVTSGNAMNATNVTITVSTSTTFTYDLGTSGTIASTAGFWVRTGLYNNVSTSSGPPVSYGITPVEYCSDVNLTNCIEVIPPPVPPATPPAPNTNPAYVRFCKTQADALAPGAVTGTSIVAPATTATPRCRLKFVNSPGLQAYIYPRYGWFNRDTIKDPASGGLDKYTNRSNRSDCITPGTAPDCTYREEIQNYARWYTYYRTRMQMMKSAAGRAFLPFISNPTATPPKPDRLRAGFITINPTIPNGTSSSSANVNSSKYLRIDAFNTTNAATWYSKFYAIIPAPSTPLRLALSRAGWIYAGKLGTGLTTGIPAADDPMQASCQKNYTILTTDGFWNQGQGVDLGGTAGNPLGNLDNIDPRFITDNLTPPTQLYPDAVVSRATGTTDGAVLSGTTAGTSPGGAGTLADIALYYYMTDLRNGKDVFGNPTGPATSPSTNPPGGDVSTNDVPGKPGQTDFVTHQHMNTFTIGLADGLMRYSSTYDTDTIGDFPNIKNAAAGQCFWSGASAPCDWPSPQADNQSALDDLWHAAVNGRGKYFSAMNPNALSTGLSGALNSLEIQVASAAAAATSSPQVASGNTLAFSTTYQTSTWSGEVYAQKIKPDGTVDTSGANSGKLWEAHKLLLATSSSPHKVGLDGITDTRILWTRDPSSATELKPFAWANLSAAEQAFFTNKCVPISNMAQCNTLTPFQLITANNGVDLVGFLRGQTGNEASVFRDRMEQDPPAQTVLGDIVNSQPVFVQAPSFLYENETAHAEPAGETYLTFKANNLNRSGPLLIGANDGYLHAFDPATGVENWAYAPRFLMPSLYQLADFGYAGQHRFFVDGTPEVTDVFDATAAKWKTIVVGGANSGGRGYYALDVTDPLNPKGLWEFCSDSTLCPNEPVSGFSHSDPDLGFTYGNPVIGRRALDGKWVVVVTSGLNNVGTVALPAGSGQGFFYVLDAITGQILHKVGTGVGDTTTPSGLMKMGGYYPDGIDDPNFTYVYGGDQLGNVWRLNMSSTMVTYSTPASITTGAPSVRLLATLKDASGRIQPITARPAGTHIGATRIYYVGTGRYLGDGAHGGATDLKDPGALSGIAWQQSIYAIRDQLSNPDGTENPTFTPAANFRNGTAAGKVVVQTLQQVKADRTISKNPVDWGAQDGFLIDLNPGNTSPGERVTLDVRLILGSLIITTTVPNSGAGDVCVPGGSSFQYNLDYKTGGYVGNAANLAAGKYLTQFLVGAAIEQTADGSIKALNKTITGQNITTSVTVDSSFTGKRFSYRER